MKAEKIYQKEFLPEGKYWLKELDYYGPTQFKRQTDASVWTIGQVYSHVISISEKGGFVAIKNCLDKTGGSEKGGKNFWGHLFFLSGGFLPFKRYKTFKSFEHPEQPKNLLVAKDMMYAFIKEMQKLATEIDKSANLNYKVKHPRFGMLNALEWYEFIIIHHKHHLKQKKSIDKVLREFKKDDVFEEQIN